MSELAFFQKALLNKNIQAFLMMLRRSEGTDAPDGYNYIFGSRPGNTLRNLDLSKHPRILHEFVDSKGNKLKTDAAGAYQFTSFTWDDLQKKLSLPDFEKPSQDIGAAALLSEVNVVQKIMDGHFSEGLLHARSIWASLPGAGYNQPEHSIELVTSWYKLAGGQITA